MSAVNQEAGHWTHADMGAVRDYISRLLLNGLVDETLRLRQALWEIAKMCGADTDGDETPRALKGDVADFAKRAATDLRNDYDEALKEGA